MRKTRLIARILMVAGALAGSIALPAAQKVNTEYSKAVDFARYKNYAWRENYLLTRQHPDDQKRIDAVLRESIDRQLQAKGLVLNETAPDLFVSYEAGGLIQDSVGVRPDGLSPAGSPTMTWSSAYPTGAPMDVWSSTLAQVRITVSDAASSAPLWRGTASQKISDPQKFLREMPKNIENVTSKVLKDFPPGAKR